MVDGSRLGFEDFWLPALQSPSQFLTLPLHLTPRRFPGECFLLGRPQRWHQGDTGGHSSRAWGHCSISGLIPKRSQPAPGFEAGGDPKIWLRGFLAEVWPVPESPVRTLYPWAGGRWHKATPQGGGRALGHGASTCSDACVLGSGSCPGISLLLTLSATTTILLLRGVLQVSLGLSPIHTWCLVLHPGL